MTQVLTRDRCSHPLSVSVSSSTSPVSRTLNSDTNAAHPVAQPSDTSRAHSDPGLSSPNSSAHTAENSHTSRCPKGDSTRSTGQT